MSWNSLTTHQQSFDFALEASGIKLDNTKSCLKKIMRPSARNLGLTCRKSVITSCGFFAFVLILQTFITIEWNNG